MIAEAKKKVSGTTTSKPEHDVFNSLTGSLQGYNCDICLNKGVIYAVTDSGELVAKRCKCMEIRKSITALEKSGISKSMSQCRFDNFTDEKPYQKSMLLSARNFTNKCLGFYFIGGQSGAGKSHICTAIAAELLKKGLSLKYMLWRDDVTRLKQIANMPEYSDFIRPFKENQVLYIDDFFKTMAGKPITQGDINIAFEIINYRYINDLITIISSELLLDEIINIDEATGSRIYEKCGTFRINIKKDRTKNYRLKN